MNELLDVTTSVRGHVTIETRDESGKVTNRAEGDNYVLPLAVKNVYNHAVARLVGGSVRGVKFDRSAFDQLWLSTYQGSGGANESFPKGDLVGWADLDRDYSGTDKMRGGINAAESGIGVSSIRIVVDFPTHAANDVEIGSVYLGRASASGWSAFAGDINSEELGRLSAIKRKGSGGYIGYRYKEIYDISPDLKTVTKKGEASYNIYDLVDVGGVVYYVDRYDICRWSGGEGADEVVYNTGGYSDLRGIEYHDAKFYVSCQRQSDSRYGILVLSSDFKEILFKEFGGIYGRLFLYKQDDETYLVKNDSRFVTLPDLTGGSQFFAIDSLLGFTPNGALSSDGKMLYPRPFATFSRFPLDNPFAKREGETMKVTYDFHFEGGFAQ